MSANIAQILNAAKQLTDVTHWLATSSAAPAADARSFLDRALAHLPASSLLRARKRMERSDPQGIDAVLHELLAFEVCRSLGMKPTFEPEAGGQQPDLSLQIDGATFWADVLVTYRPIRTLLTADGPHGRKVHGYRDAGESAKKIGDRIAEKAAKYARLDAPLIVFVMFGEYNVGLRDLETALYGSTVDEVSIDGLPLGECHPPWHEHGILCPPSGETPHRSLSAVVSCEWFDTLNKAARGRRLRFVAYHHWRPRFELPLGAFAPFCDLHWESDASAQLLHPQFSGDGSVVMSTTSDDPPRFAQYSTEAPW